jgi:radical SAM protein with 4Fe4S-binding SPASM domain
MALTINQHELHRLDAIARDLGCDFRFDPILHRRIDTNTYSVPEKYRLSTEVVTQLEMEFPERIEAHKEFCESMAGRTIEDEKLITCGAGRSSLHITPDGIVLPCSMLIGEGVSVREKRLEDIWDIHFERVRNLRKDFELECDSCSLRNVCDHCPGWSFVEHGVKDKKVQYLCDIIQMRASSLHLME